MVGRLEKVKLSCKYSKVKIVGTMVCVGGALTMSIMHSATTATTATSLITSTPPTTHDVFFDKHKIIGCLYLLAAVFALSTNVVLQVFSIQASSLCFCFCLSSFIYLCMYRPQRWGNFQHQCRCAP